MQNSLVMTQNNTRCHSAGRDPYQTHTGDETSLLPVTRRTPAPVACASSHSTCPSCHAGGQMILAEKAAAICQCSRRTIYRWIEDGSLHFRELPDGTVLICGVTLAAKLERLEDSTGALAR